MTKKLNIIIDTDIGDDADDALALSFALKCNELNILGVTTVFENTILRAKMVKHLLALAGREDIPVHAGFGHSIDKKNDINKEPCQYQAKMNNYELDSNDVIDFYEDVLSKQSATLVAIGPLSNIARLITKKPHLVSSIDELVIMGGSFYRHANEWNIVCDPEAANIVFNSGIKIRATGLDVTTKCSFDESYLKKAQQNANDPLKIFLLECCDAWHKHSGFTPILHDPLTIFSLLADSDIQYNNEHVKIELSGEHTRGMTVCSEDGIWSRTAKNANASIAYSLDYTRFVECYLTTVFID